MKIDVYELSYEFLELVEESEILISRVKRSPDFSKIKSKLVNIFSNMEAGLISYELPKMARECAIVVSSIKSAGSKEELDLVYLKARVKVFKEVFTTVKEKSSKAA